MSISIRSNKFFIILVVTIVILLLSGVAYSQSSTSTAEQPEIKDWHVDHAVIVVDDLNTAMEHFREAGFNVVPGGRHADGFDHNALIPFNDGSYIELYSPMDNSTFSSIRSLLESGKFDNYTLDIDAMQKRFLLHIAYGPGLADFAISAPSLDLEEIVRQAAALGLSMTGPIPMSRVRLDGAKVEWMVDVPTGSMLPFLIEDITPRSLRVPSGEITRHPNGVMGISGIVVQVHNLEDATHQYSALLGIEPGISQESKTSVFDLNNATIILREDQNSSLSKTAQLQKVYGPEILILSSDKEISSMQEMVIDGAKFELGNEKRG